MTTLSRTASEDRTRQATAQPLYAASKDPAAATGPSAPPTGNYVPKVWEPARHDANQHLNFGNRGFMPQIQRNT